MSDSETLFASFLLFAAACLVLLFRHIRNRRDKAACKRGPYADYDFFNSELSKKDLDSGPVEKKN